MIARYNLLFMILVILSACQMTSVPEEADDLPTRAQLPSPAPTDTAVLPSATVSFTPTVTSIPSKTPTNTVTVTPTFDVTLTPTSFAVLIDSSTPTATPPSITRTPLPGAFIFGQSSGGRDLEAFRYGTGEHWIMLVGGIHAGFEANTIALMERLQIEWQNNSREILPSVSFIVIPRLNPDGEARGRILEGRFNGNMVDLNRNWGCGWEETAEWREGPADPGLAPFDQPETGALAALIRDIRPDAVLFYHAALEAVYPGRCGDNPDLSLPLAEVYSSGSGYRVAGGGNETGTGGYDVTGSAPAWVNSIGIPSLDVELSTADTTDFERNLRALQAVQRWVASR